MTIGIEAAPARVHEIQLRGNDYAAALDPRSLQASAIAKVILRVFSDDEKNGGLYFANRSFKAVRPVLDDWAPRFHAGAVELWAWMGARYFSWIADARLLDSEWRDGRKRVIPKLDLFNPDAERVIVGLFRQLAQKAVPGILIQDDLVLRRGEGFSNWGKAYFTRATGWPADEMAMARNDSAMGRAWERCKSERIGQLLEKIVQACKGTDPRITVAMNVHYELPLEPAQARSWYAHDRDILAASALDYFYLMAYHRQIKDELALGEAANRLYFANMTTAALEFFGPRLVVKMQVRDWRSGALIPLDELRAYYDLIPAGALRVCFAAVDPGDIPLVSQVFADRSPGPQRAKK
jgi:hypothetical protein